MFVPVRRFFVLWGRHNNPCVLLNASFVLWHTWPKTAPSRSSGPQHHPSPLNPTHEIDLCHGTARTAGMFRNRSKGATPGIQSESFQPQKPLRIKLNICIWIIYFPATLPPFNGKQWRYASKKKLKSDQFKEYPSKQPNNPEEASGTTTTSFLKPQ